MNTSDDAVRVRFTIADPVEPDAARTFERTYAPGVHYVAVAEDRRSGTFDGPYTLDVDIIGADTGPSPDNELFYKAPRSPRWLQPRHLHPDPRRRPRTR